VAQMYTIHVHAIPLSDDDGKRANTVTKEKFGEALEKVLKSSSQPTCDLPSIPTQIGSRARAPC
jgi:hypothetical protein